VLVTGITGCLLLPLTMLVRHHTKTSYSSFVGTEVTLAFLEAGYNVRGTARSAAKAREWIALFSKFEHQFESSVVADVAVSGAFDDAVKGVDYVVHSK
jgi:nucleoside-diphosphate-sugar epimerase